MAAAYAALLALARSVHQILDLDRRIHPLHKEKIVSLHQKVDFILTFLEDDQSSATEHRGDGFRDAAYEAQDLMDSYLCSISKLTHYDDDDRRSSEARCDQDLEGALERICFLWEEVMKMKNRDTHVARACSDSPVDVNSSGVEIAGNEVVGFDDDLNAIQERMYEDSGKLQVIPIVGMGGIGKTTLARRAYQQSLIAQHFDICGWTTISQEYQRREILLGLLHCFTSQEDQHSGASDAELAKLVYQALIGRRYLVVVDDIWSPKAWDDLKMIFPKDGTNGSRILLTTRLSDVAVHAGCSDTLLHQMNFLNADQSWKLLQERIFGQESCPPHLVEIGKKIARNCGGLPLTIVVVAGLLSNSNLLEKEMWEKSLELISSTEPTIAQHCSKILCLSYDRLPLRLKPCFLYIAAFPEDSKINVSKLIRLWAAEGFLKPSDQSKCLEDIGEGYLKDLMSRSLILENKKGPDGKLEAVEIHDMLREICIEKAEEEGFLRRVPSPNSQENVLMNLDRRISIHSTKTCNEWQVQDSRVHSVILPPQRDSKPKIYLRFRSISILDAPSMTYRNLSDDITEFVRLRYIAFVLNNISCPHGFPYLISKLSNLQTLVAHGIYLRRLEVHYKIWSMPNLRHLIIHNSFHLSYPPEGEIVHESDLQTLETVVDLRFTEETIKILTNLKRLKIKITPPYGHVSLYLENLFRLRNLEELEVKGTNLPSKAITWNHALPASLKKLTLKSVKFLWENMGLIGSLPNLQVLEIMEIFILNYEEWKPVEGQFLQLKYFHSSLDNLVKWEAEKEHFPSLESLIITRAWKLDEIPCGIGEIDSLQLIELRKCKLSVVNSAKLLQKQQLENGNNAFQLSIIGGYFDFLTSV